MAIDPSIPLLALANQGPSWAERRAQRERARMEQERFDAQQEQNRQLQEERQFTLDQKRQEAAGLKALQDSYKQYTTLDPETGRPNTDYDRISGAMFSGGYPDLAERVSLRGQQMKKADEDYYTSILTHNKNNTAYKIAELSQVEGPEDYTHVRERMRHMPGFDVSTMPEEYDADWVKGTIDSLQKRSERYEQAMNPSGWAKSQTDLTKSRVEIAETSARTEKLELETEALRNKVTTAETPEEYDKLFDDAVGLMPPSQRAAFAPTVSLAKGRVRQALKNGDHKAAQDAANDVMGGLKSVATAAVTAPIRFQYGAYGSAAQNATTPKETGPVATWLHSGAPPGVEFANKPSPELGGYTPGAIYQAAIAMNFEGKDPGGNTRNPSIVARNNAIRNFAAAMLPPGVNESELRMEFKAKSGAIGKMTTQYMMTSSAAEAAKKNLEYALSLSPGNPRTDSKWVNSHFQNFLTNFTDAPDLSEFEVAIYTGVREYAKVTSGAAASVSGLTDSASKEAESLLNKGKAAKSFDASIKAMLVDLDNIVGKQRDQIAKESQPISNYLDTWERSAGREPPVRTPKPPPQGAAGKTPPVTTKSDAVPDLPMTPGRYPMTSGPFVGQTWARLPDGTLRRVK